MELNIENVSKVIEENINNILKLHGGYCSLSKLDIVNRCIYINLHGGCAGCPSSSITMFNIVEPIFLSLFKEISILLEG